MATVDAQPWPPPGGPYRDDRLAFLAAQDELRRMSWPWWLRLAHGWGGWATTGAGDEPGAYQQLQSDPEAEARDWHNHRLQLLVRACEDAADRMNDQERTDLRSSGALPAWFFQEIERRFHALARSTRGDQ